MINIDPKIVVNNKINENVNNRIVMIKNDGTIDAIADISGSDKDAFRHMRFFEEYFKTHYLDDSNLQKFGGSLSGYDPVLFILAKVYGNVILIDTSRTGEKANYGCIQLPDSITLTQKETLDKLLNGYYSTFNEFLIFAHPYLIDGIPTNQDYFTLKNSEFEKIYDYVEIENNRMYK